MPEGWVLPDAMAGGRRAQKTLPVAGVLIHDEGTMEILQHAGVWLAWLLVGLLCLGGIAVSCISLSGTWLVALAALMAALLTGPAFPGLWTVAIFLVICVLIEVLEAVAGSWGVTRRGGSRLAGMAAFGGGLLGLFAGTLILVPLVGSLIGMLAGSFACTYAVEMRRLRNRDDAAHIARGAVLARVLVVFLKVAATLGMIAFLILGHWFAG
jgi:uncharacterized protein YqgC (DUF456 family)